MRLEHTRFLDMQLKSLKCKQVEMHPTWAPRQCMVGLNLQFMTEKVLGTW